MEEPKVKYPSVFKPIQDFVYGASSVPNAITKEVRAYDNASNRFDMHVISDKEGFEKADREFKELKDRYGVPMSEIAKRYWSDPEFAEQQRRDIAAGRRRGS